MIMNKEEYQKSFVNIGLILTAQVLNLKTKLKQISPTLIYQWEGDNVNGQQERGIFRVKNSLTNQLVYQCEFKQLKDGIPYGKIRFTKIYNFKNYQLNEYKVKQIQSYEGQSKNLKKHGKGIYKYEEIFSTGKNKYMSVSGQWENDILISGVYENQYGKKQLNFQKNVQMTKSVNSIMIENQDKINSVQKILNNKINKLNEKQMIINKTLKQNKINNTTKNNYLDPLRNG